MGLVLGGLSPAAIEAAVAAYLAANPPGALVPDPNDPGFYMSGE